MGQAWGRGLGKGSLFSFLLAPCFFFSLLFSFPPSSFAPTRGRRFVMVGLCIYVLTPPGSN